MSDMGGEDIPDLGSFGFLVPFLISEDDCAQCEACATRWIERRAGMIKPSLQLELQRSAILDGRRGPVLKGLDLLTSLPDCSPLTDAAAEWSLDGLDLGTGGGSPADGVEEGIEPLRRVEANGL